MLFVVAREDQFGANAADATPAFYRLARSAHKKLVVTAGSAHGIDLLTTRSGGAGPAQAEVLAFLGRYAPT